VQALFGEKQVFLKRTLAKNPSESVALSTQAQQSSSKRFERLSTDNITAAWAVDREFDHIVGPAGAPFGRLGAPLGSPWDAFGPTLVSLWLPLGCFGPPLTDLWSPFGHLGRPLGIHLERLGPQGSIWGSPWVAGPIWGPRER